MKKAKRFVNANPHQQPKEIVVLANEETGQNRNPVALIFLGNSKIACIYIHARLTFNTDTRSY